METTFSIKHAIRYCLVERVAAWLTTPRDAEALGQMLLRAVGVAKPERVAILKLLLAAGASPNFTYQSYSITIGPPLYEAAERGDVGMVQLLVDAGADINFVTPHGSNAVNAAINNENDDNRAALLHYLHAAKVELNAESEWAETPLSVTSRRCDFATVRLLLELGADPAPLGWNPLMVAVALGSVEDCQTALAHTTDLEARDRLWERTAFLLAICTGEVQKAALLLQAGARLDVKAHCGRTNLMHAMENNRAPKVQWLLDRGADMHAVDDFATTALIEAAREGAADCVAVLLRAGARNEAETGKHDAPIDQATNIATVHVLLAAGADINRLNGAGYNLLKYAAGNQNYEFARELLANGADPNVASLGETPLYCAVYDDDIAMMQLLLAHGANPKGHDVDGWTAMDNVESVEAAQLLLVAGAEGAAMGKSATQCVAAALQVESIAKKFRRRSL